MEVVAASDLAKDKRVCRSRVVAGCVSSTNPLKIVCTGVGVSTGKVVGPEELMIIYIICKKKCSQLVSARHDRCI